MTTPNPQHGGQSIEIGLRDVYDSVQDLTKAYTGLSAKIDTALISQSMAQQSTAQQLADMRHDLSDHEGRIRVVEQRIYVTPRAMWTAIGVIIAGLGVVVGIITIIVSASG